MKNINSKIFIFIKNLIIKIKFIPNPFNLTNSINNKLNFI